MARSRSKADVPSPGPSDILVVNGWTLLFHPALVEQLERLTAAAERELARHESKGGGRRGTSATANQKVLLYLCDAMLKQIPQDPSASRYRQGNTLGSTRRHWRRDKFGAGRFRLFFRYLSEVRIIIYGWVNDQTSLRAYGSSTDAYRRFAEQLDAGHPPDDWDALKAEATTKTNMTRVVQALPGAIRRAD